jgi:hypothetical protein
VTVVALERPSPPPSTLLSWPEFLVASLASPWREEEWDPETWTFVGALGSPTTDISTCLRPGCGVVVDGASTWCSGCRKARSRADTAAGLPPRVWTPRSRQQPENAQRFCLASLHPTVRAEILYGLQEGDRQHLAIRPLHVRLLLTKIPAEAETVLDLPDHGLPGMQRSLLRAIQQRVRRLRAAYAGDDGTSGDVWDCAVVGLLSRHDRPHPAVTASSTSRSSASGGYATSPARSSVRAARR